MIRTRRTVLAAFAALVEERGYDAVNVQDVIRAADVGRSTFYKHFRSKEDLVLSRLTELGADLDARSGALPPTAAASARILAFSLPMFEHGQENRTIIRALLADPAGHAAAVLAMERMLLGTLRRELIAALPHGYHLGRIDTWAHQIVGGFIRVFLWWMDDRVHRMDYRDADAAFMDMVRPGLTMLIAGSRTL